ncbi:hypothetical protein SM124_06780 [Bacillus sp. 31A1R]|uniref:Uncharacterized protein n=1 Tax=Robertmurraya mangrovi TaxID=3098077 RepID=A0ABU5IWC0_9BACI|nr:hypothetical protein [Bacillus sp. 31A1R]MDZ5471449.1 hypothetical protein [Bacillus sp. 31A1R]
MILPLPEKFDENEWLVIGVLMSGIVIYKLLPKRFPISLSILIMIFSATYARAFDHILASPLLDFYDVMDSPKFELFGVFTYIMYAPFGYLFVYIYDKFKIEDKYIVLYIFIWSFFGIGFEWLSSKCNIFTYKHWNLAYSFTIYLFVQYHTIVFFRYLKKKYKIVNQY